MPSGPKTWLMSLKQYNDPENGLSEDRKQKQKAEFYRFQLRAANQKYSS